MFAGIFSKSVINPETIQKIFDNLLVMIKQKKLKRLTAPNVKQQMKPLIDKLNLIISGLQDWETGKEKEKTQQLLRNQHQAKLREDAFIKLLNQCRANISISQFQIKQRIRNSVYCLQNYENISVLMFDMISKNKTVWLIEQKLKSINYQILDVAGSVHKIIEDVKQNKIIIDIYEKIISQFINFPIQVKIPLNLIKLKDKKKQKQIQSNSAKMSELFKALAKVTEQISNLNNKTTKGNGIIAVNHTKTKSNISINWQQSLVKPIQIILKQNQQIKPSKLQCEPINKIINNLASYKYDKFQQNLCNWDKTTQQSLRRIQKEFYLSATAVKDINKRMVAILSGSNFKNEPQLQSEAIQKLWNTNILLATNEKKLTEIQSLFSIYDGLLIQIKQMEIIKKKINKNRKYTLAEEINICITTIRQLQGQYKKQFDSSPAKQKQQNITSYPKLQKDNSKIMNQYPQQMQMLMKKWILLSRTILQTEEKANQKINLQQYQFYINKFDQIAAEARKIKTNSKLQRQKNILLTAKFEQQHAKILTNKALQSSSQEVAPTSTLSMEDIRRLQNQNQQMLDKLGKQQIAGQNLKHQYDVLIKQKKEREISIKQLQSQLANFKNIQKAKTTKIRQQQQQINALKTKIIQLQKNINNLNVKITFSKSEIDNLQQSKNFVETNFSKLETDLQGAKATIKHFCDEKVKYNYQKDGLKKNLLKHQKQGQQLKVENIKIKHQLAECKENFQSVKKQLLEKLDILARVQPENLRLMDACENIKGKNKGQTEIIKDQENQIKILKTNINLIDAQKQGYYKELNQKYLLIEQMKKVISDLKAEIQKLVQQSKVDVNNHKKLSQKQIQQANRKKTEKEKKKKQVEQLKKDLLIHQRELELSKTLNKKLESQIQHFKGYLADKKLKNIKIIVLMKIVTQQNKKLIEKIDLLSSQFKSLKQSFDSINIGKQFLQKSLQTSQKSQQQINESLNIHMSQMQYVYSFLNSQIFNQLKRDTDFQSIINGVKQYIINLKEQINVQKLNVEEAKKQKDQMVNKNYIELSGLIASHQQFINSLNTKIYHYQQKLASFNYIQQKIKYKQIQIQTLRASSQQYEYKLKSDIANFKQQLTKLRQTQQHYKQQAQNIQKLKDELEEYKSGQYFDKQSWVCSHKQTLITAKSILKQIGILNNQQFKMSNLLYKYSPQDKLTWNHFTGKSNILIIIKTATNKMIAVYSLAPLFKPNTPNVFYHGKQLSFIYESDLAGNHQSYYYMLQDKKANACYGNIIAFGKSDLRFTLGEDTLQGNFGYTGTFFESKGKKMPQILGTNGQAKVKMVSYQIYEVIMSQKYIEAKIQNIKNENSIQTGMNNKNSDENNKNIFLSSNSDFESKVVELRNNIAVNEERMVELNTKLVQAVSEYQNSKSILKEKEEQLHNCNNKITQLEKDNYYLSRQSYQCSQKLNSLSKAYEQHKNTYETQIYRIKDQNKKDLQKYKAQLSKTSKTQKEKQSISEIRSLKIKITQLQIENCHMKQKISGYQLQLATQANNDSFMLNAKDKNIQQDDEVKLSLHKQLDTLRIDTLQQKQKATTANKQICELKGYVKKLEEQNTLLLSQIIQKKQKILAMQMLAEESTKVFNQKQMNIQQKNRLNLRKTQNQEQYIKKGQKRQTFEQTSKLTPQNSVKAIKFLPNISQNHDTQNVYKQKFNKLAVNNGIHPFQAAQINSFFNRGLLCQLFPYKLKIAQQVQRMMKRRIVSTKLMFEYDEKNTTSFHKYIEEKENLVCVVKTVHNVYLATYYSGKYTKTETMVHPALLIALTTNNVFGLHTPTTNPTTSRAFRGMIYDEFFMIWGNAEVRIRANDKILFSNFGISASFFNPRGLKVNDLISEGQKREVEYETYEIYQITFENEEKQ